MRNAPPIAGFTLIELLVVVTIVAVLLALMTPALDLAIEKAVQTQCGARLHSWGVAVPQFSLENRRKLLSSVRFDGRQLLPNIAWGHNGDTVLTASTGEAKRSEWSAETMQPYVQGGDYLRREYSPMWYCPANAAPAKERRNKQAADDLAAGWFVSDYAYFARSDLWGANHATRPDELTDRQMAAGRLLMADALYYFKPTEDQSWWFNHGEVSHSTHQPGWGGPVQKGRPMILGTSQLTGDGAVRWKDRSEFDIDSMYPTASPDGRWASSGSNRNPTVSGNYW